tara:strand:- start:514 stop:1116 length:603 start_codon:yes stop_codon:yes gene_type:complete
VEQNRDETRGAIIDGARAVLRSGTVFDLTPEAVAFASGVPVEAVFEAYPGSDRTNNIGEIVFDIAETVLNNLMVEISELTPDDEWATNLADTTVVLLTSDPDVNRQALLAAASLGRGTVRRAEPVALNAVGGILEDRKEAGEAVDEDRDAELRLIVTLFRGVIFAWASDRFDQAELHARMLEVADIVISQRDRRRPTSDI